MYNRFEDFPTFVSLVALCVSFPVTLFPAAQLCSLLAFGMLCVWD